MAVDPNSQLAIVPDNKTEQDLVDEQIDERILNILGLQDVFDIDYGTYVSLLRERVAAARMMDTQMSTDESELVTDEFRRVRGKTGRFKIKKKKVNIGNVVGTKPKEKTTQINPQKLLPGTAEAPEKKIEDISEEQKDDSKELRKFLMGDLFEAVQNINTSLNEILSLMQKQSEFDKKTAERGRIEGQKQSKKKREDELESGVDKNSEKLLDKVVKPFTSLFDVIKNFLLNVLLGSAVVWLMDIIKNPRKLLIPIQKLIDGIFNFFNGFIKWIDSNLIKPIRNFIDAINNGIKGFVDQLNKALKLIPGSPQVNSPQLPNIPAAPEFEAPNIVGEPVDQMRGGGLVQPRINLMKGGGLTVAPKITTIKQYSGGGKNKGSSFSGYVGKDTGTTVSGLGQDTQLTALRKGEFVLVPGAAQELGIDNLMAANTRHGGTNKPRTTTVNNMKVKAAAGGGGIDLWGISPSRNSKLASSSGYGDVPTHHRSYSAFKGAIPKDYAVVKPGVNPAAEPHHGRGLPVAAGVSGKVGFAGYAGNAGNMVEILNSSGKKLIRLLHLDKIKIRQGATVSPSTIIGTQGNTGTRDIHVHVDGSPAVHTNWIRAMLGGNMLVNPRDQPELQPTDGDEPLLAPAEESPIPLFMADIRGAANQKLPPAPPEPKTPTVVPLPLPAPSQGKQSTSGSSTNGTSQLPKFSSTDNNNLSVVATSSILQVGGS